MHAQLRPHHPPSQQFMLYRLQCSKTKETNTYSIVLLACREGSTSRHFPNLAVHIATTQGCVPSCQPPPVHAGCIFATVHAVCIVTTLHKVCIVATYTPAGGAGPKVAPVGLGICRMPAHLRHRAGLGAAGWCCCRLGPTGQRVACLATRTADSLGQRARPALYAQQHKHTKESSELM
jgi:hypothetical protein